MRHPAFTISGVLVALLMAALTLFSLLATTTPGESAERCIRIARQGNIETLVNICDVCRVARITRSRPGSSVPVARKFNVQAGSTFPVPFRGPGRTRVQTESPCPGQPGAPKDLLESFNKPEVEAKCVSIQNPADQGIFLVNSCSECRAVAIVRMTANGKSRQRDYLRLTAGAQTPVPSRGFAQVGLLGEIDCPEN